MSAILIQHGAPTFFHVNGEYAAEIDYILFLKKAKALASIVRKQHGSKSEEVPIWIGAPRCKEVRSLVWQDFFQFPFLVIINSGQQLRTHVTEQDCSV